MNVGSVGNFGYMAYVNPVGTTGPVGQSGLPGVQNNPRSTAPITEPNTPTSFPSITPYSQSPNTPAMTIFNFDGDSAEFTLPALNKSLNTERIAPLDPNTECETCANRKYVDGSDDSSVSFQTPTNISPNMAAAAVASHENEHVRNEQAKAARDGREIVQQSVTLHYDVCEECGRHYVSGGTTRTTSVSKSDSPSPAEFTTDNEQSKQGGQED